MSYAEFLKEETGVLIVDRGSLGDTGQISQESNLQCPVLADEDGRAHRDLGVQALDGKCAPAVYVTDRYGEFYAVARRTRNIHSP